MPEKKQKRNRVSNELLSEPATPGTFRICPNCGGWFALRFVRSTPNPNQGRIDRYQCKKCGEQTDFAKRHPPEAV